MNTLEQCIDRLQALSEILTFDTLSHSELATFGRCAREHFFAYVLKRKPRFDAEPLRFGNVIHRGLNALWLSGFDLDAALATLPAEASFDTARATALLVGYHTRWASAPYETITVEAEFLAPISNPESGRTSRTYRLRGFLDVIALDTSTGEKVIVEHKTTSEDIGLGASYWRRVTALDPQVSTYYVGARALGHDVKRCVYDVIRKPAQKPAIATPVEAREYTKPKDKTCPGCRKKNPTPGPHVVNGLTCADGRIITDPGGRLYSNQREFDETPDEFLDRLTDAISAEPDRYYARGDLVRLEGDEREHAADIWHTARLVREAELQKRHPRNTNSCRRFGRFCPFFDVCSGDARIDDDEKFVSKQVEETNVEL